MIRFLLRTLLGVYIQASLVRRSKRATVLAIGFSTWKECFVRNFFAGSDVLFLDSKRALMIARNMLKGKREVTAAIWSFNDEGLGITRANLAGVPFVRIEDGFIRSTGRGVDREAPWSLCVDERGLYFDASVPSDFEQMCNNFDDQKFTNEQARVCSEMRLLIDSGISKYNMRNRRSVSPKLEYKHGSVLVLGQVETDQSIIRNKSPLATNRELLSQAVSENPAAVVYFKQHPDCVGRRARPGYIDLVDGKQSIVLGTETSIFDAISSVDTVYTISSLGGFEGLLRGKRVVTFGCPFYAGWGLTTDNIHFPRRTRSLTLEQLFYIAYLKYPRYFNPYDGRRMTFKQVLQRLSKDSDTRADISGS